MQLSEKSNNILLLFYYIFVIYIKLWAFSVLKKKNLIVQIFLELLTLTDVVT